MCNLIEHCTFALMDYIKLIILMMAIAIHSNCYSQKSYFYSIDSKTVKVESHDTITVSPDYEDLDTEEDSLDVSESMPDNVKQVKTVSLPLSHLSLTSPFGIRRDPLNRKSRRMHNGMDLKARFERVYAMLPGTISDTGFSKNGGYYVTINHGVCVCSYLHLSKILVSKGDHITAGTIVAVSGSSGLRSTGPHLHISCRYASEDKGKGKYFNPMLLLQFIAAKIVEEKGGKSYDK